MKKIIFISFIGVISCFFLCTKKKDKTTGKKTSFQISFEDKETFIKTFHYLFANTEIGYTFFGNKPLTLHYFPNKISQSLNLNSRNIQNYICLKKLASLRNKYQILGENNQNFFISLVFKEQFPEYSYMLFINKKAFIKTVTDNLSLFQHLLGWKITPKELLFELDDHSSTTFTKLLEHPVLLGLLLGYGKTNSLVYDRKEKLQQFYSPHSAQLLLQEISPFLRSSLQQSEDTFFKIGYGYSSLEEELLDLREKSKLFGELNKHPTLLLPNFSYIESLESQYLYQKYVKTQKIIEQTINSPNFLKIICEKLSIPLSTFSQNIPSTETILGKKEATNLLAQAIYTGLKQNKLYSKKDIYTFIQGLKAKEPLQKYEPNPEKITLEIEYLTALKIQELEEYFAKMDNKNLISIFPQRLFYEKISAGEGKTLTSSSDVKFSYRILPIPIKSYDAFKSDEKILETKTTKLISGLQHALIGMQKKEKRKIFIHPEFTHGNRFINYINPGLIIEIELLDFKKNKTLSEEKKTPTFKSFPTIENIRKKLLYLQSNYIFSLGQYMNYYLNKNHYAFVNSEELSKNLEAIAEKEDFVFDPSLEDPLYNLYWKIIF